MKRRRRKKSLSPYTVIGALILCCVLCGILLYQASDVKMQYVRCSAQVRELKKEQKKLENENEKLKDFEKYVKTKEYTEEIAREKLGLVYPDEIVFEPNEK